MPMNVTSTKAPQLNSAKDMIELHVDGHFLDLVTNDVQVFTQNTLNQPARYTNVAQIEQFFISEPTGSSAIPALSDDHLPLHITDEAYTSALATVFPEMKLKYGHNVTINVEVKLAERYYDGIVEFTTSDGILLGQKKDMRIVISFFCQNETMKA